MSNAAQIAEMIVEGEILELLESCRGADGKLQVPALVEAFKTRFPTFDYDDIVNAIDVATELMVADLNAAREGL